MLAMTTFPAVSFGTMDGEDVEGVVAGVEHSALLSAVSIELEDDADKPSLFPGANFGRDELDAVGPLPLMTGLFKLARPMPYGLFSCPLSLSSLPYPICVSPAPFPMYPNGILSLTTGGTGGAATVAGGVKVEKLVPIVPAGAVDGFIESAALVLESFLSLPFELPTILLKNPIVLS